MRANIIDNLDKALKEVFGNERVISSKINLNDVGDTLVDCCLLAVNDTTFNYRGQRGLYVPELSIDLVIFNEIGVTPLITMLAKEDTVIEKILTDPTRGGYASDTIIVSSSASNIFEKYSSLGEISSVIRLNIPYNRSY